MFAHIAVKNLQSSHKGGYKTRDLAEYYRFKYIEEKLLKSKHIIPDVGNLVRGSEAKEKGKAAESTEEESSADVSHKPAVGSRRSKRLRIVSSGSEESEMIG